MPPQADLPYQGSGTTGVVAKRLHRQWIGFEKEAEYVSVSRARIDAVIPEDLDEVIFDVRGKRRKAQRVPFSALLEYGLLQPGQQLFYRKQEDKVAVIKPDARLVCGDQEGTIHQLGRKLANGSPCNELLAKQTKDTFYVGLAIFIVFEVPFLNSRVPVLLYSFPRPGCSIPWNAHSIVKM